MSDEDKIRDEALNQLRQEMLDFIVEDISVRVNKGELRAIGARFDEAIRERTNAALADALRETRLVDAKAVAAEIVRIYEKKVPAAADSHEPPGREGVVSEVGGGGAHPMRGKAHLGLGGGPEDGSAISRELNRAGNVIWAYWHYAVIAALALAVGYLAYLNGSFAAANDRANALSKARAGQVYQACIMARQMDTEATLLRDDTRWKSLCTGAKADRKLRICRTEADLKTLADSYRKYCA
jgi:hypothetical protein